VVAAAAVSFPLCSLSNNTNPMSTPLAELLARLDAFRSDTLAKLASAASLDELESVRAASVGRTRGALNDFKAQLPTLAGPDKPAFGQRFNAVKLELETALEVRQAELSASAPVPVAIDLSMPARRQWRGAKHPITIVMEEIEAIFRDLGFTIATGPEAEHEWYNFGALNFPPDHPAMDMHDTLYLAGGGLLRTHTSPVQIRTLQSYPPPIRIIAPGNVFRRDFFDASHAPMFAQIEGMAVDERISFVDLKATLAIFANRFFGETKTRFRPSFFPFTEPSAEMDVACRICDGAGCATCKQTGWVEILGCGMMHPSVLEAAGLDTQRYSGWAFGMGPGRMALQRFGIPDIRIEYDSDISFLEQFAQ
jgi:phenylalanyl-tRNA synthetase alpha chain